MNDHLKNTRSPARPDPNDEGTRVNYVLTILLVTAAALAVIYLVMSRDRVPQAQLKRPDVEAQERRVREWATDKLELQVSGVSCDGPGVCTVVPKTGAPFRADCRNDPCVLMGCDR